MNDARLSSIMGRLGLVLLMAGAGPCATLKAATHVAASPNRAAVLTAYNACANGDTLSIPAGTSTPWTDQIVMAKNITIKGAGKNSTILVNGIPTTDWHGRKPIFYVTAGGTWRITGIGFDGQYTSGGKGVVVVGGNGRINDCYFYRCYDRGVQTFTTAGLIDHCVFVDCWSSASFYSNQYPAWSLPLNIGTTNCWVFEDNYDRKTGAYYAPIGSDGAWGARYVWRYNVLSNTAPSGMDYALDAHGNQGKPFGDPSTSIAGTVFLESYNNLFSMGSANRGTFLRGGTQIHFNNTFLATGGNYLSFGRTFMLTEEDGYRLGSPIKQTWPGYHGHTNSYYFNNSLNGTLTTPHLQYPGNTPCTNPNGCGEPWPSDSIFIQLGRDYWLQTPTTNFYRPLRYPHPRVVADNDPVVPATFALSSPANGATGFSMTGTLAWSDTTGETSYRLLIARDYYFSDVVLDVAISPNSTSYGPIQPGVLANNVSYYWLIRAIGPNGVNTSTDAPWRFTTGSTPTFPPVTPVNFSPDPGAASQSLTETLQGTNYSDPQASAHLNSQFIVYAADQTTIVKDSGTLGAVESYAIPSGTLDYQSVYYWKVRYQNTLGLWSDYSTPTSFSTLDAPAPFSPFNSSPADMATDVSLSPTLIATAYSDPSSSPQTASQWQVINGTNVIDSGTWPAAASYAVPVVLSNATVYTWQVRYKNTYDIWSAFSTATSFTTTNSVAPPDPPPPPPPPPDPVAPNTPSNLTPTNNAFNVTLTPELLASAYSDPQLSPQAASQWLVTHAGTNLLDSGSYAPTNTFPVTNILTALTLFSWQVRYQNTFGLWSSYSIPTTFTTTNVVIPPDPPPPSTNPPVTPPPNPPVPTNAPANKTNIVIFRGTVELRGVWSSE